MQPANRHRSANRGRSSARVPRQPCRRRLQEQRASHGRPPPWGPRGCPQRRVLQRPEAAPSASRHDHDPADSHGPRFPQRTFAVGGPHPARRRTPAPTDPTPPGDQPPAPRPCACTFGSHGPGHCAGDPDSRGNSAAGAYGSRQPPGDDRPAPASAPEPSAPAVRAGTQAPSTFVAATPRSHVRSSRSTHGLLGAGSASARGYCGTGRPRPRFASKRRNRRFSAASVPICVW